MSVIYKEVAYTYFMIIYFSNQENIIRTETCKKTLVHTDMCM